MAAVFFKKPTLNISMQYFADPASGETNEQQAETNENSENEQQKPPTLKELLASNKAYQSEYDKMLSKAQETAIANARAKWEADAKAQADEAAKLAKMNAEEKAQHEREKREKELADREAAVTRRELKAEARAQLAEQGLPAKLADVLDFSSAENCKASFESVTAAFNEAVQDAVNERLRSKEPPKKGQQNTGTAFEKMTVAEKMVFANEHPNDPEVLKFLGAK